MKSKNSWIKTMKIYWFVDNKLSINFDEDRTKSIPFTSKRWSKNVRQLNIRYNHVNIKQHAQVTCLGCVLDETMSCEPIALTVISKINGKLKFLYKKNRYLTNDMRKMLCNALIQPHFHYAYPAWSPNLNEETKKKIQIMQNKCISFSHKLNKMHHISEEEFRLINWLPTNKRVDKCINTVTYNFFNDTSIIIWMKYLNSPHIIG